MSTSLPTEFADLARFVPWALPTEDARMRKRLASSMVELTDYYRTLLPRMEALAEHLSKFSIDALPAEQKPLLYLALSFMESAMAVEAFHHPGPPHATTPESMVVFAGRAEEMLSRA